MGLYDVVEPCAFLTADGRAVHYTRPGTKPVEINDAVAAPLVESGDLVPFPQAGTLPEVATEPAPEPEAAPEPEPADEHPKARRRVHEAD